MEYSSNAGAELPSFTLSRRWIMPALLLLALAALGWWLQHAYGARQGLALLIGMGMGLALYHAAFGFTTAWRRFIVDRRGAALRAQCLMLALGVCLFFPVLSAGELFGNPVSGFVRPLGLSVVIGAFLFGLGMQLGDGCASGNLYHAGGGRLKALPSMVGFTAGALYATYHYEWWTTLSQLPPVSLINVLGTAWALVANLALFAVLAWITRSLERRRHGGLERAPADATLWRRLLAGPWPFVWAAVILALLNFATLALLGRPWAVAMAYPLWGARLSQTLGIDLELDFWLYWTQPAREQALFEPLLQDATTVMNIGILLGALLAAALAGRLRLEWRLPWQQWLAAVIGGLLLGYGATIAYGCNIGAFFGGIVSGSLHGWLWLACAFAGSMLGTRLRPWFRLGNDG